MTNQKQTKTKKILKSKNKSQLDSSKIWVYGKHPSFTILKNNHRKIFEILVTKNSINELESFLTKESLLKFKNLIRVVNNEFIENVVGKNQIHQNIAIRTEKLKTKNQFDLIEELYLISDKSKLPTLLILDQITDPQNIGAIIRSAVAFNVKKIIFCEHNSPKENATIIKTSAGNIDFAELIVVTNFNNLIEKLKKIGYWCIGLASEGNKNISEIIQYDNIALVVGSEGDGIRELVKKNCDLLLKININKSVESLNVSVATSLALYEIFSKKNV